LQNVDPEGEHEAPEKDYAIIHARSVKQPGWVLQDLSVFYFGPGDQFIKRLDAPQARLKDGQWIFEQATTHRKSGPSLSSAHENLKTQLSIEDIEESFSSPQSLSFWRLPQHIKTLEETGFNTSRLKVHYQNLLAQPLFLTTMVLLAAIVSIRPPRFGGALGLFASGVLIGFLVFFMSSYLQALGASQQIPAFWAGWSPALICLLLGLAAIMTLEDG
jgi:lipopolysaccharide export system permease protein